MKFSVLSDSLEKMELTTKRLELTDILVELIKKTPTNRISKIIYLYKKVYDFSLFNLKITNYSLLLTLLLFF